MSRRNNIQTILYISKQLILFKVKLKTYFLYLKENSIEKNFVGR
ncbi:hypothetical protein RINTU1_35840 [Candidatus Regiella insecticola]|uniref:Uncharacterized protein n=1 Tax=Candidatus Regiella insecticola TaxID=138073 RepID=A0A6L2ZRR5_9ENTR|nr:hypothetical protein RINTU1_35420 [Candidatus Regiella insecticola]GFN47490.1 hypothetical protein RINTU1_35840 [Candidatus Regiella insecticola]